MKRFIILIGLLMESILFLQAQQLELGLRDNNFAYAAYKATVGWLAGYEQSLLNVKMKEQSGRVFAGYQFESPSWLIGGVAYYGTEYSNHWNTYGAVIKGKCQGRWGYVEGTLNPHHDSGLDGKLCYRIEAGGKVYQHENRKESIAVCASYGDIPEYRMPTKCVRTGLKIQSGRLWVKPMIILPNIDKDNGGKFIRVMCDFGWSVSL